MIKEEKKSESTAIIKRQRCMVQRDWRGKSPIIKIEIER